LGRDNRAKCFGDVLGQVAFKKANFSTTFKGHQRPLPLFKDSAFNATSLHGFYRVVTTGQSFGRFVCKSSACMV
jgi:hypothetical protein